MMYGASGTAKHTVLLRFFNERIFGVKRFLSNMIPLLIGVILSAVLAAVDWFGFWFIFAPIGASVSLGFFISARMGTRDKDLGRKISISLVALILLSIFQGFNSLCNS